MFNGVTQGSARHVVCVLGEENAVEIGADGTATFPAGSQLLSVYVPETVIETLSNIPIIVRPEE